MLRIAADADESAVVVVERTVDGYAVHDKARHLTTARGAQKWSRHAQQVRISPDVVDLLDGPDRFVPLILRIGR